MTEKAAKESAEGIGIGERSFSKYTKYEIARMIGARALQISMGAPFLVKLSEEDLVKLHYNPVEIAKLEFEKSVIPIAVKRPSASSASSASKE